MSASQLIYHIAPAADVERAARSGIYSPGSLASEGFMHCSYASQVAATADRFFRGQKDLLVLEIDPTRLQCRIVEESLADDAQRFPHVYGSLPMSAVLAIRELRCRADGSFEIPCVVRTEKEIT
jgi:uncharacterized protein (DUF952 family)